MPSHEYGGNIIPLVVKRISTTASRIRNRRKSSLRQRTRNSRKILKMNRNGSSKSVLAGRDRNIRTDERRKLKINNCNEKRCPANPKTQPVKTWMDIATTDRAINSSALLCRFKRFLVNKHAA